MLGRIRAAGLLVATLTTAVMLPVLVGLGFWQLQRKAWKEGLIARLEHERVVAPATLALLLAAGPVGDLELRRVRVAGTFEHPMELHVWQPRGAAAAWSIVTPLRLVPPIELAARAPISHVLVIRGEVDAAHKSPDRRAGGQIQGPVEIVGRVRLGGRAPWTPPDVSRNQWLSFDLAVMRAQVASRLPSGPATASSGDAMSRVAPVLIEAAVAAAAPPAPTPRLDTVNLSNRHLQYAITWLALAATLIGVYTAFAAARLKDLNANQ